MLPGLQEDQRVALEAMHEAEQQKAARHAPVTLGFVHPGMVHTAWMDSVMRCFAYDAAARVIIHGYVQGQSAYIPDARNKVCRMFLDTDSEWLWFTDYDVVFDPQQLYMLLDAADPIDRPIISGCYFSRYGPGAHLWPVWFEERDGGDLNPVTHLTVGEIMPLTVTGMGFTLIHRTVLERMQAEIDDPWPWFGHDQIGTDRVGEDITFCARARKLGFTVWGHSGVLLGHNKQITENWDTFTAQDFAQIGRGSDVTVRR